MKFLSKQEALEVINVGLEMGADFVEVFMEDTDKNAIQLTSNTISQTSSNKIHGASVRVLEGTNEKFGYVNDFSVESLKELTKKLCAGIKNDKHLEALPLKNKLIEGLLNLFVYQVVYLIKKRLNF